MNKRGGSCQLHQHTLQNFKNLKHISICHLNTQSMTSTFDEFQFMVNESKFDIITLSETWLKNDKHLLEYVNLPGYKFCYRNRDEKRGVGVGLYIEDYITCKGKKLIDHICSNICKKRILHSDVLPCPTISDHDAPYIIVNIPTNKYEIRYKFIRNLKHFDLET